MIQHTIFSDIYDILAFDIYKQGIIISDKIVIKNITYLKYFI